MEPRVRLRLTMDDLVAIRYAADHALANPVSGSVEGDKALEKVRKIAQEGIEELTRMKAWEPAAQRAHTLRDADQDELDRLIEIHAPDGPEPAEDICKAVWDEIQRRHEEDDIDAAEEREAAEVIAGQHADYERM